MAEFLKDNISVNYLNLSYCDLRAEGLNNLGNWLSYNRGIKTLILQGNDINDEGV
jgi:hypothetical protein